MTSEKSTFVFSAIVSGIAMGIMSSVRGESATILTVSEGMVLASASIFPVILMLIVWRIVNYDDHLHDLFGGPVVGILLGSFLARDLAFVAGALLVSATLAMLFAVVKTQKCSICSYLFRFSCLAFWSSDLVI